VKNNVTIEALAAAAKHLGGVAKLAAAIGTRQSAISNWRKRGTFPSPAYCLSIERATNGAVTRKDLRPHDYAQIWPDLAPVPIKRRKRKPTSLPAGQAGQAEPEQTPEQTVLPLPAARVAGISKGGA